MGSQSDYKTMQLAEKTLKKIGVSFETKIISAHRTPKRMYEFATSAETIPSATAASATALASQINTRASKGFGIR